MIRIATSEQQEGPWQNRLMGSSSHYLAEHAHQPVDWMHWGAEAFQRAKQENKPVFLSIGYSACHWCHVMARESFDNVTVATFLNQHFVAIKVDREEWPDVDSFYIHALLKHNGEAGWPASLFLSPQGEYLYGGTYFPPYYQYGLPSFLQLLETLAHQWTQGSLKPPVGVTKPQENANTKTLVDVFNTEFDYREGGWGQDVKFPMIPRVDYLLSQFDQTLAKRMLNKLFVALDCGGIHDHLAGGFHRYTVDPGWETPHYEKMLYDSALIARAALRYYSLSGESRYFTLGCTTLEWLLTKMQTDDGLYKASINAEDAQGEGDCYKWNLEDVQTAIGVRSQIFQQLFQVDKYRSVALKRIGDPSLLGLIRDDLMAYRDKRPQPSVDSKTISAWNSMVATAMMMGWRLSDDERYLQACQTILTHHRTSLQKNGRLSRIMNAPTSLATLEDYAWALEAALEFWQFTQCKHTWHLICALFEQSCSMFIRSDKLCLSSLQARQLLPGEVHPYEDHATPSSIAIFLNCWLRLQALGYNGASIDNFQKFIHDLPHLGPEHPSLQRLMENHKRGLQTIVITGDQEHQKPFIHQLKRSWKDDRIVVIARDSSPDLQILSGKSSTGAAKAWVCTGTHCSLPILRPNKLQEELR